MLVFVLLHTTHNKYGAPSEIVGVYASETLARDALMERKTRLLESAKGWVTVEEHDGGRVLAYGGRDGIAFTPGVFKITEHEVIGV